MRPSATLHHKHIEIAAYRIKRAVLRAKIDWLASMGDKETKSLVRALNAPVW